MDRRLVLEIVRVTEHAALASAEWIGLGDKHSADNAATLSMREMLDTVPIDGTVVIGEGEMDEAPMLYIGEQLGTGQGLSVDIAVDPLEGTELVANGLNNSLAVIAIAKRGQFLHAPDMYMEKLACGPVLKGKLSLDDPIELTLQKAATHLHKSIDQLTVMILDRERHQAAIDILRRNKVRIKLLASGDIVGAIAPSFSDTNVDLYLGSGGAPEGVLAAAALSCLGGEIQGRLMPGNEVELARCQEMGIKDPLQILTMKDMVGDDDVIFSATGITGGDILDGVSFLANQRAETHSLLMRSKSKTIRFIKSVHFLPVKEQLVQMI